jgi:predicted dehydrogenase
MKYKLLVLGCGNIGALYDWDTDAVLTHMKSFSKHGSFEISCYDTNEELLERVCRRYNANKVTTVSVDLFRRFDVVSVCTPTFTHETILTDLFQADVPVILCEKPISDNFSSLENLAKQYKKSKSKVIVNYIRRFQPDFIFLARQIKKQLKKDPLTSVAIRYQRGMINNCSHAFDLLNFLFEKEMRLEAVVSGPKVFDHFNNDPTFSLIGNWNEVFVNIMGLPNVRFSHFEIDIFFTQSKIAIRDSGNTIDWFFAPDSTGYLQPLELISAKSCRDCLKDYMVGVSDYTYELLQNLGNNDNFMNTLEMNKTIIKLLN